MTGIASERARMPNDESAFPTANRNAATIKLTTSQASRMRCLGQAGSEAADAAQVPNSMAGRKRAARAPRRRRGAGLRAPASRLRREERAATQQAVATARMVAKCRKMGDTMPSFEWRRYASRVRGVSARDEDLESTGGLAVSGTSATRLVG
jgi:hypothetical protein